MSSGTAPAAHDLALTAQGLCKSYPGVVALDDVSLQLVRGRVHVLCGENGAGKSTLVGILTGGNTPDSGQIVIGDRTVSGLTPRSARSLGIGVIHQERQIAMELSVSENVMLGNVPKTAGRVNWREMRRQAAAALDLAGLDLDPMQRVDDLGVAQLQGIEVARALAVRSAVILMDEPTSALAHADTERLLETVKRLTASGVAVLYISHHLSECLQIGDDFTILRDGKVVRTRAGAGYTERELIADMLGREPAAIEQATEAAPDVEPGEVVIDVREAGYGTALGAVSLRVHRREIVCVTGAIGSGGRELALCAAGAVRPDRGMVLHTGTSPKNPRHALRGGIVYLPEDRKRDGLLMNLSILENIALGPRQKQRGPLARPRWWRKRSEQLVQQLRIKTPSVTVLIQSLSGGNQQKAIIARWIAAQANGFVLDEPTAGIDVGARFDIYRVLRDLADRGAAVLVFTSDIEEARILADRLLVISRGQIVGTLQRSYINAESVRSLEIGAA